LAFSDDGLYVEPKPDRAQGEALELALRALEQRLAIAGHGVAQHAASAVQIREIDLITRQGGAQVRAQAELIETRIAHVGEVPIRAGVGFPPGARAMQDQQAELGKPAPKVIRRRDFALHGCRKTTPLATG